MKKTRNHTQLHRETLRHLTDVTIVRGGMPWDGRAAAYPYTTTKDEACSGSCCTLVGQTY